MVRWLLVRGMDVEFRKGLESCDVLEMGEGEGEWGEGEDRSHP